MRDLSGLVLTIPALREGYKRGEFSPADVVREVFRRVKSITSNPVWIHLVPEADVAQSVESLSNQTDLPLFGIPFAVKDNIDIAGIPTTAGCPAFSYVPDQTARVAQRLIAGGAVMIGKTNLDQFATGLVGMRSPYGACSSVFHSDYISGGSSSGSAVAVAAGLVSFALGTDTAGSGRVPAAFNNIVGFKPTRGLLSTTGVVPACRSLDCVSLFTLTANDADVVFSIASGYDPSDPYSRRPSAQPLFQAGARIGVLNRLELLEDYFRPLYREALERLKRLGYATVEVDISPLLDAAKLLYGGAWVAERFAAVGNFVKNQPDTVHPVVREIILGAQKFSAADAFEYQYALESYRQAAVPLWESADVLLLPTAPAIYRIAEVEANPIELNSRLGTFTNFLNLLDLAGVAVPAGFTQEKLPFSVTFVGPAFSDRALLKLAERYLRELRPLLGNTEQPYPADESLLRKDPDTEATTATSVRLAVVGAHLSGFPLNHQLTDRGAKLVETTMTAPEYRLYALPETNPPKPGLVRTRPNEGRQITVEVWEISYAGLGSFLATIAPPLAIGTLKLQDGRLVKGFLCESVAVQKAEDISSFGGWQNYTESLSPRAKLKP